MHLLFHSTLFANKDFTLQALHNANFTTFLGSFHYGKKIKRNKFQDVFHMVKLYEVINRNARSTGSVCSGNSYKWIYKKIHLISAF